MNYEELVKALRCCISKNPPETCVGCTYSKCNNECAVRRMILDAAAAIDGLQKTLKAVQTNSGINFRMWEEAQAELERLQAQLPKRGEWVAMSDVSYKCSVCGETSCCRGNFCSDCGAKMEVQDGE